MAAKAKTVTLTSGVVSTFDLTGVKAGDRVDVSVHGGTVTAYVRLDGTDPVAAADENYPVLGGTTRRFSWLGNDVKVIATGTPVVTVARVGG